MNYEQELQSALTFAMSEECVPDTFVPTMHRNDIEKVLHDGQLRLDDEALRALDALGDQEVARRLRIRYFQLLNSQRTYGACYAVLCALRREMPNCEYNIAREQGQWEKTIAKTIEKRRRAASEKLFEVCGFPHWMGADDKNETGFNEGVMLALEWYVTEEAQKLLNKKS